MRSPCCEKMGVKKGPWTPEEDQILISYIQRYGHDNWRAIPKQAGLLRCGKSCRLRWTNYLRPDIKRGNFSKEEEETIMKLHRALGNRWSAIATKLPGRTDNEIKNFWHTHLKKRIEQNQANAEAITRQYYYHYSTDQSPICNINTTTSTSPLTFQNLLCAPIATQKLLEINNVSSSGSPPVVKTIRPANEQHLINNDMAFWYNLFIKSGESNNILEK